MATVHAICQAVAVALGLVAAYGGLLRFLERTRDRSVLPGTFRRRRHVGIGAAFAVLTALGYGLGVWAVHRSGRDVLTSVHALVGTVLIMLVAVVAFLGTALVSREDDRLARIHRLFGGGVFVLFAIQIILGLRLLAG